MTLLQSVLIRAVAVSGFTLCALTGEVRADTVNEVVAPGNVIEGHAKFESECSNCHKQFNKAAQSGLCKECHKEIARDIKGGHGMHGHFEDDKPCNACHTEHKGRDARIAMLDARNFDHKVRTGFELKGAHAGGKVQCKDCHSSLKKYREAPTTCFGCHGRDDKHKGRLGNNCQNCHVETDWKTTHFDHSKTDYPLLGKHVDAKCKSCHINEKYKDTPKVCNECHKKDDKHKGNFGPKCETCHVERGWKENTFDHDKKTNYPLIGKHREVKCVSCHKGDLYKDKLKTDCYSCHQKDDEHKGHFGPKCESCHVERGWKEIIFDHDKKTKYPLRGKHREAKCTSCHKGDLYKGKLKTDCYSCHQKDDKHKASFGPKCETCHVERGWKELLFDHDKKTRFPLLGKHREVKCGACHKGDLYKDKLKTDCYSCHQKADKHKGQEGRKCEACHSEKSWKKFDFDHRMAHFPLTGKHLLVECRKCHATETFRDVKSDCYSCHEKKDVHTRRLGTGCAHCHNTRDWRDWDFDHDKTGFKLDGKHKDLKCVACHTNPVKLTLGADCASCHGKDDKHDGAFRERCERCHVDNSWKVIKVGNQRWTNR